MATEAIIFDLDGTLTVPVLDFDAIRAELGMPTGPILEAMATMSPERRAKVVAVLEAHEAQAAHGSDLYDGAVDTLNALRAKGLKLAILTRNSRRSVKTVLAKHGLASVFDALWTREDGPFKPSPEPVLQICERLGVSPCATIMVGDYLFDIQAGAAAGARTVLMVADRDLPEYADQADHTVRRLGELRELVD